jgi:hypothetical protein
MSALTTNAAASLSAAQPIIKRAAAPTASSQSVRSEKTTSKQPDTSITTTVQVNRTEAKTTPDDEVQAFLQLGRKKPASELSPDKKLEDKDKDQDKAEKAIAEPVQRDNVSLLENERKIRAVRDTGNAETTLKQAEAIEKQARQRSDLTAQERAVVAEAKRLANQARLEIQQERREAARQTRLDQLEENRAEQADKRRRNTPSPFRPLTTPFDKVEEGSNAVKLGNLVNINA